MFKKESIGNYINKEQSLTLNTQYTRYFIRLDRTEVITGKYKSNTQEFTQIATQNKKKNMKEQLRNMEEQLHKHLEGTRAKETEEDGKEFKEMKLRIFKEIN